MFRYGLLIGLAIVTNFSTLTHADTVRLSEPVQVDESSETFGAAIEALPKITSLRTVLEDPSSHIGEQLALSVEVSKVCKKKGCFFIAQESDKMIRVSFKDYGFFVPTDIGGQKVILLGKLVETEVSSAQAKHLSKDLGESGKVKPGKQYEIVATSVRIPKLGEAS